MRTARTTAETGGGSPVRTGGGSGLTPSRAIPERLVERDGELEQIRRRLRQAAQGRGGALVIEGPAGMGKTALLAAARAAAEADGFRVLRARGAELDGEFPFAVVRQLVEPLVAEASEEERASLLEGPARLAARVLGLPGVDADLAGTEPIAPDPGFAVLHGLHWLCANLAAQRPVLLAVDDAHLADSASLRFLSFLLPRLEELHIALLLAAWPVETSAASDLLSALTMDSATGVVSVRPLTTGGVAQLIVAGLGCDPGPEFATACREVTGGTPFLVRALVTALVDEGISPSDATVERLHGIADAKVGRWALLQLGRLGEDAVGLARAIAVLERAELGQAAALAGLGLAEAAGAAELLVRAGLLEERPLAFAHPILRAGLYGMMPAADRAETHRRAARLLAGGHAGASQAAEHLLSTVPAEDAWVVDQLRVAAQTATASGAPESAAAYLRRALAEPPAPEARPRMLVDLGMAEFKANLDGWERHLSAAIAAAADSGTRTSAAVLLATALGYQQRYAEAVEVCDRVATTIDRDDSETLWTLESIAVICGMGDAATAPSMTERANALIAHARQGCVTRQVAAVAAYRAALANEPAADVAELARIAIAGGPRQLPEPGDGLWFTVAVRGLLLAERSDEVRALIEAAVSEARATANGLLLAPMLYERGLHALRHGDLVAAVADARASLEDERFAASPRWWAVRARAVLAIALVERAELDAAERELEPMAAILQAGTVLQAGLLRHARGRIRFAQRRFQEAVVDFLAAGDIATRSGAVSPCFLPWRSDAALGHLALGDLEAARRLSDEELELARAYGAPRVLGLALRAAGLVAGGVQGEPLLRESIEVLGTGIRLERARALADLGALLRRSGRRVEAREVLRQALDVAHRAGARLLAVRAETELRATGAKPRRVLLTGVEALTTSERRIAELAGEGLTNRQIAQALFVTAGTVEGHLTNVFTKLAVRTRTELAQALQAAREAA